jgi:hypothetical protein
MAKRYSANAVERGSMSSVITTIQRYPGPRMSTIASTVVQGNPYGLRATNQQRKVRQFEEDALNAYDSHNRGCGVAPCPLESLPVPGSTVQRPSEPTRVGKNCLIDTYWYE